MIKSFGVEKGETNASLYSLIWKRDKAYKTIDLMQKEGWKLCSHTRVYWGFYDI